jgi:hypothetical protein
VRVFVNSQSHQGAFFLIQNDPVFFERLHQNRGRGSAFFYNRPGRIDSSVRFQMVIVNMDLDAGLLEQRLKNAYSGRVLRVHKYQQ